MRYKLIVTNRAIELLDNIIEYIVSNLKNPQAAKKLLLEIEGIYNNLENNPEMYGYSDDVFLKKRKYRKVIVPNYKYIIFFQIDKENNTIYIMGIFHHRELYNRKL